MHCKNELMHYGVLGMKWGIHRANRLQARSNRAKRNGNNEAAKRLSARAKKKIQYHEDMGGAKTYERVKNTSTGALLVESAILGTYGALKYNESYAQYGESGRAFVNGLGQSLANRFTGGLLSLVEPRMRRSDARMARG